MPTFNVPSRQFNGEDERVLRSIVRGGDICEIGCWTGKSTSILARHGKVVAIDTFKGSEGTNLIEEAKYNDVRSIFDRNMKDLGFSENVAAIQMTSDEAVRIFKDESFDFLFIDGDHRYSQVKRDIENWYPKVKSGGRIAGHDFDKRLSEINFDIRDGLNQDTFMDVHCGVVLAVTEFFDDFNLDGRIWWADK